MDDLDRRIINNLQGGFPVSERPFLEAAQTLGIGERDLIDRLEHLLEAGVLSRFGPMYHAERLGGGLTLAALAAPPERFDEVTALVNAHPEVAHNYERDHELNMWFVFATERPERHRPRARRNLCRNRPCGPRHAQAGGVLRRPEVRGMSDGSAHRRP